MGRAAGNSHLKLGAVVVGNLEQYMLQEAERGARAASYGIKRTVDSGKLRLRQQVLGAFGSKRLANSWRGNVYPKLPKTSLSAAGTVITKAGDIIGAHARGGVIRAKKGLWLAIPSPDAPKTVGRFNQPVTPATFPENRYGKLRFVYRPGKASLLVVDAVKRSVKTGRVTRQLANQGRTKSGGYRKGAATVVMFFLVPFVTLKKRLDVQREFQTMENAVVGNILSAWREA